MTECDALAQKHRKVLGVTKQGYLWITDRGLMVTEKLNPGMGISKDVVLSLSQSKVAERRQEQQKASVKSVAESKLGKTGGAAYKPWKNH